MNIPETLVHQWWSEAVTDTKQGTKAAFAQRAAEWALQQPVSMEPVAEIAEFDHPEHAWKWTRMELNFINRKLAAARQQGAEEERARLNLIVDKARAEQEAHEDQALRERDEYHEVADDLAAQIAAITGEDIGEHSSMNDPWHNAMLAADDFIAGQIKDLLAGKSDKQRIAELEKSNAVLLSALKEITNTPLGASFEMLSIARAAIAAAEVKP